MCQFKSAAVAVLNQDGLQDRTTPEEPPQVQARHRCGCTGSGANSKADIGADAAANAGNTVERNAPTRPFPEVPQPSLLIIAAVGDAALRGLVRRHHDLLRASEIGAMFPEEDALFDTAVVQIADFVVESCGGAARYTQQKQQRQENASCLRSHHLSFTIDPAGRDTWLGCLWQALEESGFPPAVREEYWNWAEPLSVRLLNRLPANAEPRRYPYDSVQFRIRHPAFAMCRR